MDEDEFKSEFDYNQYLNDHKDDYLPDPESPESSQERDLLERGMEEFGPGPHLVSQVSSLYSCRHKLPECEKLVEKAYGIIKKFASGVCLIEIENGNSVTLGTGFHYGGGHVISNSHVLKNPKIANQAKYWFYNTQKKIFIQQECEKKVCLTKKLHYSDNDDDYQKMFKNVDLALVDINPKEIALQDSIALTTPQNKVGDLIAVLHCGSLWNISPSLFISFGRILEIHVQNDIPFIKHSAFTCQGSSGGMIVNLETQHFVGITFGGKVISEQESSQGFRVESFGICFDYNKSDGSILKQLGGLVFYISEKNRILQLTDTKNTVTSKSIKIEAEAKITEAIQNMTSSLRKLGWVDNYIHEQEERALSDNEGVPKQEK